MKYLRQQKVTDVKLDFVEHQAPRRRLVSGKFVSQRMFNSAQLLSDRGFERRPAVLAAVAPFAVRRLAVAAVAPLAEPRLAVAAVAPFAERPLGVAAVARPFFPE